ncbi:zinc-binding dehydrogenase [Georgenia wutianyii]|uniref:zinc-binding dehydrogenase n=1 Tax=Georgenia wutianyii TaxID=2585135 RepID=UPI00143CC3B9|nr:zinc-binding dehydrogenase [Georgenia wutianyii]
MPERGRRSVRPAVAVVLGAEVYAAEVREEVWPLAESLGVVRCVSDITELADLGLDVILDFAGFGTTTAGAVDIVGPGGRVVQVGMGRLDAEINMNDLIVKEVDLIGSLGGGVEDLTGVHDLMASGRLTPKITRSGKGWTACARARSGAGRVGARALRRRGRSRDRRALRAASGRSRRSVRALPRTQRAGPAASSRSSHTGP